MSDSDGVVLYLRVSTEDQDLAGQKGELVAYAATKGWSVIGTYEEKASASGKVQRAEYEQLLADARIPDRGWRRVLVWALDRWSRERSFVKAVGSIEELEAVGIAFHSFKEPWIDSTADGEASLSRDILRGILPAIASFESRRRSERTRVAMGEIKSGRRKTRTGRPPGRPRLITPELLAEIRELREHGGAGGGTLEWKQVAIRAKVRAGTCKKAYSTLRRETPRVVKGPGEFVATTGAPPDAP